MWIERAGELGEYRAFRLLVDCFENGYCDVPVDPTKAALWRNRLEEFERLNPPAPSLRCSAEDPVSQSSLERLLYVEGVTGFAYMAGDHEFNVSYDPALIAPAELDERIRALGFSAAPMAGHRE